mmetsp:Transcript_28791/g.73379  ORF Transcript_28791/g.73379 Transcript_28791/m.73379 type:complete len:294 (+) Transcript_28791:1605-2486(+)
MHQSLGGEGRQHVCLSPERRQRLGRQGAHCARGHARVGALGQAAARHLAQQRAHVVVAGLRQHVVAQHVEGLVAVAVLVGAVTPLEHLALIHAQGQARARGQLATLRQVADEQAQRKRVRAAAHVGRAARHAVRLALHVERAGAGQLLGRLEQPRAAARLHALRAAAHQPRQPKVNEHRALHAPARAKHQHHVLGLHVRVHHRVLRQVLQRRSHVPHHHQQVPQVKQFQAARLGAGGHATAARRGRRLGALCAQPVHVVPQAAVVALVQRVQLEAAGLQAGRRHRRRSCRRNV